MFLGILFINIVHPGHVLVGPQSEFPSRKETKRLKKEQERLKKEQKQERKQERKRNKSHKTSHGIEDRTFAYEMPARHSRRHSGSRRDSRRISRGAEVPEDTRLFI